MCSLKWKCILANVSFIVALWPVYANGLDGNQLWKQERSTSFHSSIRRCTYRNVTMPRCGKAVPSLASLSPMHSCTGNLYRTVPTQSENPGEVDILGMVWYVGTGHIKSQSNGARTIWVMFQVMLCTRYKTTFFDYNCLVKHTREIRMAGYICS